MPFIEDDSTSNVSFNSKLFHNLESISQIGESQHEIGEHMDLSIVRHELLKREEKIKRLQEQ